MRVTVLGCGGSDGVPLLGGPDGKGDWGACDPADPRNRRTRSSVHISGENFGVLVDAAPDLRQQLLAAGIARVDAVLFTHEHADHSHGLHELRRLANLRGAGTIPCHADNVTAGALRRRFGYAFEPAPGSVYPAFVRIEPAADRFDLGPWPVRCFEQDHGFGQRTRGYRIGPVAYTTDAIDLPEAAFEILDGVALWIVDCQQARPHPTHAHLDLALSWIARVRPRRALLTHLGHALDYAATKAKCPPGVEPAYDGLVVDLPG
jgi:phosphoribosyl 1,2-cyclic phosphate phosphodiesterase